MSVKCKPYLVIEMWPCLNLLLVLVLSTMRVELDGEAKEAINTARNGWGMVSCSSPSESTMLYTFRIHYDILVKVAVNHFGAYINS